jgi:hypothetical protein
MMTSPAILLAATFHTMVCNRLEVICHEDLDTLAAPHVVRFVATTIAQSRDRYSKNIGEARLMVGNCIRIMCRSPKSRAGCHFAAAIGLRSTLEDYVPEIPDWANDQHTARPLPQGRREDGAAADRAGRIRGRGLSAVGEKTAAGLVSHAARTKVLKSTATASTLTRQLFTLAKGVLF